MFEKDWITCSRYDNHFRLNIEHNYEGGGKLYDRLMCTIIFTLTTNEIFHVTSKIMSFAT